MTVQSSVVLSRTLGGSRPRLSIPDRRGRHCPLDLTRCRFGQVRESAVHFVQVVVGIVAVVGLQAPQHVLLGFPSSFWGCDALWRDPPRDRLQTKSILGTRNNQKPKWPQRDGL